MRTFAELLREYTARTGISDAELARTLGVRRQTVFRWKEGLVARPRDVADVLRCAARLRLTPQERDELLIAAGFPPEGAAPQAASGIEPVRSPLSGSGGLAAIQPAEASTPSGSGIEPVRSPLSGSGGLAAIRPTEAAIPARAIWLAVAALLIALAAILYLAFFRGRDGRYPVAAHGETLIVVGQFVNYAGGQQGYNVAGRIQEALQREIAAARLAEARIAIWPEPVGDEAAAQAALRRSAAGLVIWGEYDSGRVLAHVTAAGAADRRLDLLAASPAELSATINSTLPEEVRYLALLTVGQLYVGRRDFASARATLTQALARPPADPAARTTLYAALGYVCQVGTPADLERAIELYS
jgi:DNA-binding XRE family transcriptional regulator